MAIRIGAVKGDQLIERLVGRVEMLLFAAPSYLDRGGKPRDPADLAEHDCLTLPSPPVYAVTSSRLQPAGVRAFVDFLAARLSFV